MTSLSFMLGLFFPAISILRLALFLLLFVYSSGNLRLCPLIHFLSVHCAKRNWLARDKVVERRELFLHLEAVTDAVVLCTVADSIQVNIIIVGNGWNLKKFCALRVKLCRNCRSE